MTVLGSRPRWKIAPATRRRQRGADRKQSGPRDRGTDWRFVPPAAALALEQRIRELAQVVEQRRDEMRSFVTRKEQAESRFGFARADRTPCSTSANRSTAKRRNCWRKRISGIRKFQAREEIFASNAALDRTAAAAREQSTSNWRRKTWRVQNLRERIQQKYHVNLDDIRSECITITFADEGPAKGANADARRNGGERRGNGLECGCGAGRGACRSGSMKWAR